MLSLSGISKSFDGRRVLDRAELSVSKGEVHALLGENGAGKSTLMNVLTGIYAPDEGTISLDHKTLAMNGPRDAIAAGIGMVHQHFRLVERFTGAQNLMMAAGRASPLARYKAAADALRRAGADLGLTIDPDAVAGEVSVAERQRMEICKVLAIGARIVVLDEPTAVLTDQEAEAFLAAVHRMAEAGRSIILITHKLREVLDHCDRVTVMRQGKTVAANRAALNVDTAQLAALIVGEDVAEARTRRAAAVPGDARLRIEEVSASRFDGAMGAHGISLAVHAGEILGIAGIGGNGQQQLADAIAGTGPVSAGRLILDGIDITRAGPAERRDRGLRIIPSDRAAQGFAGDMSAAENFAMTTIRTGHFGGFFLSAPRMRAACEKAISAYAIAGAAPERPVRLLSGGNAQKLLLARELDDGVRLLVAHSPTRGLDVRAAEFVRETIGRFVAQGAACLLISEDLEEILALSNRIAVMSRGRITGELPGTAARADVGALMLGHA